MTDQQKKNLRDLIAYIRFDQVLSTIGHDVNGLFEEDANFLPRTSGYGKEQQKHFNLYHHKTDGGAEYLFDTFFEIKQGAWAGHKEGTLTPETKYIVRIDGDITKDAELTVKEN